MGLFQSTTRIVLPRRNYSAEELSLIFRHELVHINRNDTQNKFVLAFCTATCWFNPLRWLAMKKNAEDLELSCDETVLWGKDEEARKLYARLILDTAGESAGFTTCLSAAASSLRYRLKHIVKPRTVRSGALTVGIIFFALYMSCGHVALAYESGSGTDTLFMGQDPKSYSLIHVSDSNSPVLSLNGEMTCTDPQGLIAYLADLKTDRITGALAQDESGRGVRIQIEGPDGIIGATLSSNYIKVVDFTKDGYPTFFYYLPDGADWDYLDSILPVCPTLTVVQTPSEHQFSHEIGVTASQLIRLIQTENDSQTILKQWDPADDFRSAYFTNLPEQVTLEFSHPLTQPFRIEVESWDGSYSYTIHQDERFPSKIVTLPPYPARYTVYATLDGGDSIVYEAQFRFQFAYLDMDERYTHHTESEG